VTPPALDAVLEAAIREIPRGVPADLDMDAERAYQHALSDLIFFRNSRPGPRVHAVEEHLVPVDGGEIRVRIYRPRPDPGLPCHVMIHGGGWKLGSIDERVNDAVARTRCLGADCAVVAVEYRLAPEHRFPVPLLDCCAALHWVVEHADRLGVDAGVVSVGGVSAGGNLAAAVALHARDTGGPRLCFQLLEVPALDLTRELARATLERDDFLSHLPQPTMDDAVNVYLERPEQGRAPLASPLAEPDLANLPPTFVMTAEFDMLRTEGERFAERLRWAGVPTEHRRYAGALHGTSTWTRIWEPAARWQRDAVAALRSAHAAAAGTTSRPRIR
jgi:acetyl esterase